MGSRKQKYTLAILASLSLGLAPFFPEPHLFGKVRWIIGGADGMQVMDWFDFAMHGAPFAFLVWLIISDLISLFRKPAIDNNAKRGE
jgi:hypothetical protein